MEKISEILREAVESKIRSGDETAYSLAREAKIGYAGFHKWLKEGRDIRASTIDAIAEYLGLTLVVQAKSSDGKESPAVLAPAKSGGKGKPKSR